MQSRSDLRRTLRSARQALSGRRRRRAQALIARRIRRLAVYRRAGTVAAYLPFDGEVDLRALLDHAAASGKALCLPSVDSRQRSRMHFSVYRPGRRLRRNRFGIWEPACMRPRRVPPGRIHLVLTPLVGFDETGTRIGMGGAYYDSCFAGRRDRVQTLIGIAFDCQKLEHIERQEWDVPMDMIVTEKAVYRNTPVGRPAAECDEDEA